MRNRFLFGLAALWIPGALALGCFRSEPPPPPPAAAPAGKDALPALPPDPRGGSAPGRRAAAGAENPVGTRALPKDPVEGGAFNRFFPKDGDGYNVTYTQEKKGFALAEVSRGGRKLALLSVSDAAGNPPVRDKFQSSGKQVAGYPAAAVGSQGTAILVADRFQVQARSSDPAFGAAEREAWLARFDLNGLAGLP